MLKFRKPERLTFPVAYSIKVRPSTTVKAGSLVTIQITYESGQADDYGPSIELLRDPRHHPEAPERLGPMTSEGSNKSSFDYPVKELGSYAFAVRPFSKHDARNLVEIHTIDGAEEGVLGAISRNLQGFLDKIPHQR
jgi:hypothetical protein